MLYSVSIFLLLSPLRWKACNAKRGKTFVMLKREALKHLLKNTAMVAGEAFTGILETRRWNFTAPLKSHFASFSMTFQCDSTVKVGGVVAASGKPEPS